MNGVPRAGVLYLLLGDSQRARLRVPLAHATAAAGLWHPCLRRTCSLPLPVFTTRASGSRDVLSTIFYVCRTAEPPRCDAGVLLHRVRLFI